MMRQRQLRLGKDANADAKKGTRTMAQQGLLENARRTTQAQQQEEEEEGNKPQMQQQQQHRRRHK